MSEPTSFKGLLNTWHMRVRRAQISHFQSAVRCERQHLFIGLPTVLLSTVVGSSVFASLQKDLLPVEGKIAVGVLSILAAMLAAVQTFLRYSERAEMHRVAGTAFGALKKELELKYLFPPQTPEGQEKYLTDFLVKWNDLVENSPTANEAIFQGLRAALSSAAVHPGPPSAA